MATKDWRDNSLTDGDDITSIDVVEFLSLIEQFESGVIQDVDGDTKIQVEESSDEDKIRFDTGGIERAVLDSSGLNLASGLTYNINGIAHNHDASYIAKPSTPSHLDLLAFITNDWAKVAQSWASGDLLFVNDNSGTLEWKRLPKGTDGQVLKLASGLPSWAGDGGDLFFARYGYTFINIGDQVTLETPDLIINDTSVYTSPEASSAVVKTWNSIQSYNSAYTNCRVWATWEFEGKTTDTFCDGSASMWGKTYVVTRSTTYNTFGSNSSYLVTYPLLGTSQLALTLGNNCTGRTCTTTNNKIWINKYQLGTPLPSQITTSWMNKWGFSGVKYIELFDSGDTVKINNDTDMIFTGISGCPTPLYISTTQVKYWDKDDYEDITQVEIVSGNPLIVFEKG